MGQIYFRAGNFALIHLNLKDNIKQMSVLCSSVYTFINVQKLYIL